MNNYKNKTIMCSKCRKKPVVTGKTRCQACADYDKKRSQVIRDQRRVSGKCIQCGGEKTGRYISLKKCKSCCEKLYKLSKKIRSNKISINLCSRCLKNKPVTGQSNCKSCLESRKDHRELSRLKTAEKILKTLKRRKPKQGKDPYGFVYKVICQDNNKVYIGQTVDFNERQIGHIRKAFNQKVNTPFANALRKYGKDKFSWEVIHDCYDKKELNYWEWHYINKFDSFCHKNGYNVKDGVLN